MALLLSLVPHLVNMPDRNVVTDLAPVLFIFNDEILALESYDPTLLNITIHTAPATKLNSTPLVIVATFAAVEVAVEQVA